LIGEVALKDKIKKVNENKFKNSRMIEQKIIDRKVRKYNDKMEIS
jgi:hypothetical protein